jgi:putative nucleotidyltransferase with HDIG domain
MTKNQLPLIVYHDLIESVVAALEAKDVYSANHSRRVSDMVEKTCIELKLPDKEAQIIHMAAHVHDIGKIGVPDFILTKPNKLTNEEWLFIRQHPQIGANILSKSGGLTEIADIVLHHHERWDGNGYPDELRETNIPYGSRVIAVCDSIDAMLSRRSYRNTLTAEQCKLEIQKNINRMYDPQIAGTVLEKWDVIVTPIQFV